MATMTKTRTKKESATRTCGYCQIDRHEKCRGRCFCTEHKSAEEMYCLHCGEVLHVFQDEETKEWTLASELCDDRQACDTRVLDRLERENPELATKFKWYIDSQESAAEVAAVERKAEREAKPTTGTCEHCGEPTKGGKFVAGHDAKLKSILLNAAKEGDIEAAAEMTLRHWPTKSLDDKIIKAGMALVRNENGTAEAWLRSRVMDRIG